MALRLPLMNLLRGIIIKSKENDISKSVQFLIDISNEYLKGSIDTDNYITNVLIVSEVFNSIRNKKGVRVENNRGF